jgi:hypothetical protein
LGELHEETDRARGWRSRPRLMLRRTRRPTGVELAAMPASADGFARVVELAAGFHAPPSR